MESTDQMLIGTVWTRTAGKHGPVTGTIDQTNNHGPRLKLDDGSHRRLSWLELDFGWHPAEARSNKRYNVWRHANRLKYLDQKDAELKSGLASLQTAIESETTVVPTVEENGTAVQIEQTKECHGPWHRHGDKYEQVPLSQFSVATRGKNIGELGNVCDACREKHKESEARSREKKIGAAAYLEKRDKPFVERKKPGPKPGTIHRKKPAIELVDQLIPGVETPEGTTYRWRITITVSVDHFVQGKDFLEAAAQVSELGEITKVEKL